MKNTIKFLFTIILLLAISNVQAQSHDMSPGSTCKLIKTKVNSESHICPACAAKDKKEKEAKVAENKRRDDAIVAKAKAENDARQAAFKEEQRLKQEQYKKERDEKVVIDFPKKNTSSNKSNTSNLDDINKYDAEMSRLTPFVSNEYNYSDKRNVKILYDKKVVYESNEYSFLTKVYGKKMFVLRYTSAKSNCSGEHENNSIIIDEKGQKINLPGLDKFGHFFGNRENDDYFDIAVYNGTCTLVENDNYAKGDWQTTMYTFSYSNMQLVSTKPSWQHSSCGCK